MPTPPKTEQANKNAVIIDVLLRLLELAPILVEHGPAFIKHFRQNAELTPEAAADLDRRIAEWGTKPSQKVQPK